MGGPEHGVRPFFEPELNQFWGSAKGKAAGGAWGITGWPELKLRGATMGKLGHSVRLLRGGKRMSEKPKEGKGKFKPRT